MRSTFSEKLVNFVNVCSRLIAKDGKFVYLEEESRPDPNATEFMIVTADSPQLDSSNLVVGRVVEGYDVIKKITEVKVVNENSSSPYFQYVVPTSVLADAPLLCLPCAQKYVQALVAEVWIAAIPFRVWYGKTSLEICLLLFLWNSHFPLKNFLFDNPLSQSKECCVRGEGPVRLLVFVK